MTAMTAEERELQSHAADRAVDSDALASFLAGPFKGAPAVTAINLEASSYDPTNVQRRRWGVGAAIEKPTTPPTTPPASAAAPSWWQQTSWFAGAVPDVAPVLADPAGADGGTPSAGGIVHTTGVGGATCQNRFVGPGQRQPHDPQTAKSVRVHDTSSAACEDPGEIYGGYNAVARATGGGAYTPVGGAMVHSRLSIQPRVAHRVRGPRCADEFEAATRPAATTATLAAPAPAQSSCAFASAAARPKYGFDFERGVWQVQGSGAAVVAPRRAPRSEAAPLQDEDEEGDEKEKMEDASGGSGAEAMTTDADQSDGDGDGDDAALAEETSPEELALMQTTRDLRLTRFAAPHEAALAAAAETSKEKAAARANKRAVACISSPSTPPASARRPAPRRDGEYTNQHTAPVSLSPSSTADHRDGAAAADAAESGGGDAWQMLRLTSGEVVFFGAADASPERVAAWLAGDVPWPEVRVMELSRRERCQLCVPRGAPGPLASDALAEAAREELRAIAEEEAAAAAEAKARAESADAAAAARPGGGNGDNGNVRLPAGSTATPQQANIIEQLVNATGASREAADAAGAAPGGGGKDKEVAALQDKLREVIRQKQDAVVAGRAAEARIAALEAAMAAAGLVVPPGA